MWLRWFGACLIVLATAQPAPAMTLYTSELLPDVQALTSAFIGVNPGVDIKVFRSGSGEVVAKLRAESEAGNPQADAIWMADAAYLERLTATRALRHLNVHADPASAYGNGTYFEVRRIYNGIAINTNRASHAASIVDWEDLQRPELRGAIAMPDPNYSGAALSTLGALTKRFGFGFFERLKRNGLRIERSNPLLLQKLAGGEYAAAIAVDFTVRAEKAKGAPLDFVYPRAGAIDVPTPIAVLSSAKDPVVGERFVQFLLTEPAQAIFAARGYIPVVPNKLKGAPPAPARTLPSAASVILRDRAALLERFNRLFDLGG